MTPRPFPARPWHAVAAVAILGAAWLAPVAGYGDAWDPFDNTSGGGSAIGVSSGFQRHGPHTISPSDHDDWFQMFLSAGQHYHFDTNGMIGPTGTRDTVLELYSNPAGSVDGYDDDSGCGSNSSLEFTPTVSGTYYLKLRAYLYSYTITGYLNFWIPPSAGSPLPFTPPAPTGPSTGVPCDSMDFIAQGADPLKRQLGYEWDYNSDGIVDDQTPACGTCVYGCPGYSTTCFGSPGTKFVRVRVRNTSNQVSSWSPGLTVTVANPVGSGNDAGKGVDAGDTAGGALAVGGPGTLTYPSCVLDPCETSDYYKVFTSNGTPLVISVQPCATLICNIDLYSPTYGWRTSSYGASRGAPVSVSYTADATGFWYVNVWKYASACYAGWDGYGQYTLAVTGGQPVADLHATLLYSGSPVNVGMWYDVILQVTNIGTNSATSVSPWINVNWGGSRVTLETSPAGGPVTLVPGASQFFTWTYSATGAGQVQFTVTGTGTDATNGFSMANAATGTQVHQLPALLGATVTPSSPLTIKDGGSITLVLSASNIGQAAALGVTVLSEASSPIMVEGTPVTPVGVTVLPGSALQDWTWVYNAISAPGVVTLTATVLGTDANSGNTLVAAATTANITVTPAAVLRPSLSIAPSTLHEGEFALVTLTTTNVGSANAIRVAQRLTLNPPVTMALIAGPVSGTVDIASGGGVSTTSWILQALTAGTQSLTGSATGRDAWDGSVVKVGAAGGCFIQPLVAATLQLSPLTIKHGDLVTAVLTLSNTGSISATLTVPAVTFSDPAGGRVVTGPAPATGALLMPGQSGTWVWTLVVEKSGQITVSAGASGIANGIAIAPVASVPVTADVRFPVELAAFPNPVKGDSFTVTIKPDRPTSKVQVEVYNMGRDRVYSGVWRDVVAGDQDLVITGVMGWAPGLYFVRAHAEFPDGRRQEFALLKVAVKR